MKIVEAINMLEEAIVDSLDNLVPARMLLKNRFKLYIEKKITEKKKS